MQPIIRSISRLNWELWYQRTCCQQILQLTWLKLPAGMLRNSCLLSVTLRVTAPVLSLRLVGRHAWPLTDKLVDSLAIVSKKLSIALHANCQTELFPSPLAFTSVRGLGLKESKHLAGEL